MKTLLTILLLITTQHPFCAELINDSTKDQTKALQDAINGAVGSELTIPKGVYLTDRLNIPSNTRIKWLGVRLRSVNKVPSWDGLFTITNASNVSIEGVEMSFYGVRGDIWLSRAAIHIANSNRVTIKNCFIHDSKGCGIRLNGGNSSVLIDNNRLINTDAQIVSIGSVDDIKINGNYIEGGTSEGITLSSFVKGQYPTNFIVSNNTVKNKVNASGISVNCGSNGIVKGNIVKGVINGINFDNQVIFNSQNINDFKGVGYFVSDVTVSDNDVSDCYAGITHVHNSFIVSGNRIKNIQGTGIYTNKMHDADTLVTISVSIVNNQLENVNTLNNSAYSGIDLTNTLNSQVSGNIITNCNQSSLRVNSAADLLQIVNNSFSGYIAGQATSYKGTVVIKGNILSTINLIGLTIDNGWHFTENTQTITGEPQPVNGVLGVNYIISDEYFMASEIKEISPTEQNRVIKITSKYSGFTIRHNANIRLINQTDIKLSIGQSITLTYKNGVWTQI